MSSYESKRTLGEEEKEGFFEWGSPGRGTALEGEEREHLSFASNSTGRVLPSFL